MPIWCPKCKYKTVLKRFYDDRCPQCRTEAGPDDVLRKDPFKLNEKQKRRSDDRPKKFQFDQKGGADGGETGSGALKSIPTESLGFFEN